jgi:hypothetical protein
MVCSVAARCPVRRDAAALLTVGLLSASTSRAARADEPVKPDIVFVGDANFGMEGGIRSSLSMGQVVLRYDELLPTVVHLRNSGADLALKIVGRLLQEVFIDGPLEEVEADVIHEVFGHGARAREFGQPATYLFSLPEPYRGFLSSGSTFSAVTDISPNTTMGRDQDIAVREAGLEANYLTARWINLQMVASDGWVRSSDLDIYVDAKVTYLPTYLSNGIHDPTLSADDVVNYVTDLQDRTNLWRPSDRTRIVSNLQTAYAWNFIDPTLYFALYAFFVDHLYGGQDYSRFPLPSAFGVTFYPETRFNLSPFGAEHYLDLFLRKGHVIADLYARVGSSGIAPYAGGGAYVDGVRVCSRLSLGAEVDVWDQPELFLSQRNVYDPPQVAGLNGGLYATAKVYGALGVTAKLSYKSSGYLMGQPFGAGPYGLGFTVTP